jgi:tetratricopeptide (TPR) repeat protein
VLAEMVDSMVEKHEVRVGEEARDALVEKTRGSKSAPEYIDTALRTADGDELTVEDVEDLSDSVVGMWKRQYEWLGNEGHDDELRVLRSMKALYDFNISLHSRLVRSVYLELFDGDRGTFKTAVESLSDDRRWVSVVRRGGGAADEVLGDDVGYYVHDTQLDAVGYEAKEDAVEASEILLEEIEKCVPEGSAASAHFYAGVSLYNWERYYESEEQYKEAIEADPEYAEAYNNYGVLLHDELDEPERAREKYEEAIEHDPEHARTYYNYGNLLKNKLDEPEEAAEKYEKAVDIFLQKGELRHALVSLRGLVEVCVELDDKEAVVENCELALKILDEAPHLDTDGSDREWFESKRASAKSTDGEQ